MVATDVEVRKTMHVPKQPERPRGPDDWAAWRIRYEREKNGWSTGELARLASEEAGFRINQSAVWAIESGDPPRKISYGEAIAFCKVFGIAEVGDLGKPPSEVSDDEQEQVRIAIDQQEKIINRWREYLQDQERIIEQAAPGDHVGRTLRVALLLAALGAEIDQVLTGSESEPDSQQPEAGNYRAEDYRA